MTLPDAGRLYEATEATWPAARVWRLDPWTIRDGRRGGQRVSAATLAGELTADSIAAAESAMADLGQPCLFMIRQDDAALDKMLAERGYSIKDPVVQYVAPVNELARITPPRISTFAIWPPLAIMTELWAEGGIGLGRIDVMVRVMGRKTAILARQADRAAGCGFVALDGSVAMVHAVEVAEHLRRMGTAANMMRTAAQWAQANGAEHLGALVTAANVGANALYSGMGMTTMGRYHYRIRLPD